MELNDPYPRENFKTKYMAEFKTQDLYNPVKIEPKLYRKNKRPMELTTSNKEDYKTCPVNPESPIYPNNFSYPTRPVLATNTANSYNYPDWGARTVSHEKRWHPPVRTTELPFKGKSSYRKSYSPVKKNEADKFFTDYTKSTAYGTSFALGPKMGLDDRTTYSDKMRNYSGTGLNARIRVKAPKAQKILASPSNFYTTSQMYWTG